MDRPRAPRTATPVPPEDPFRDAVPTDMPRSTSPPVDANPRAVRRDASLALVASLVALVLAAGCAPLPPPPPPPGAGQLWADVAYIGDPDRVGRQLGSPGRDSVTAYIARAFAAAGLRPVGTGECAAGPPCESAFAQPFPVSAVTSWGGGLNVVGLVPGTDPSLGGRPVVVGAHYDHVGRVESLSRDPGTPGVRPGADDNASGTAALLELARRLGRRPAPRPVLFVAFDAEELGLIGSEHFVADGPLPPDSLVAMLNLDMVGRLRGGRLTVRGAVSDDRWRDVVEGANADVGLSLLFRSAGGGSDHMPFLRSGVPALHFFTGLHPDYHTRRDRVDRLNVAGMLRVVDLVEAVLREVATRW